MFCSKQEDVGDERRLKPLAEEKKLVLQSSAEPVEMNGGQGRGEKGAETESHQGAVPGPRKHRRHPDSSVVTGKVSSNLVSPSHKAFHHHCLFADNAQSI